MLANKHHLCSFVVVNTPHALPHVLGLLSWLTTLAAAVASTDYDYVVQDALQNDEDAADESFPYGNAAVTNPLRSEIKLE